MPFLHVNDVQLYYEVRGEGPPLLLIPGLGSGVRDYKRIVEALSRTLRVVIVDPRGAGLSDQPDAPYSIEMMAEDADGLLTGLGIGSAHVLGHSMGGRIALALALRHPERAKSLILVSTGPRMPPETRGKVGFLGAFWRRNPILQRLDWNPQPYYAFLRQLEASRSYDATRRLHEIRAPTLILHGRKDRLAPLSIAEEMNAQIAGSRLVPLRGGHLVLFFDAPACVRTIDEFVRKQ